jgi:hypothetical protein
MLLDSSFPVKDTGLTKDQILNNLLFKLEDVEKFEKKHSKSIQNEKDSLTPKDARRVMSKIQLPHINAKGLMKRWDIEFVEGSGKYASPVHV